MSPNTHITVLAGELVDCGAIAESSAIRRRNAKYIRNNNVPAIDTEVR